MQRALRSSPVSTILQISTYDAQYWPLELLKGQPCSPSGDSYALACTLLEMLAGKNPFAAASLAEIEQKHAAPLAEPLFPPENAPWQISRVLEQALSPKPGERFKNASELVAALKHATSPGGVDRTELARREAQVEAWRLSEQQARQQAEETARLAALEQARREIQEQAHREVQALEGLEAETQVEAAAEEAAPPASRRRERRRPARPRPLTFLSDCSHPAGCAGELLAGSTASLGRRPGAAYADRHHRHSASRKGQPARQHERGFCHHCEHSEPGFHGHGFA